MVCHLNNWYHLPEQHKRDQHHQPSSSPPPTHCLVICYVYFQGKACSCSSDKTWQHHEHFLTLILFSTKRIQCHQCGSCGIYSPRTPARNKYTKYEPDMNMKKVRFNGTIQLLISMRNFYICFFHIFIFLLYHYRTVCSMQ